MKSVRRLAGVLSALSLLVPVAAFAAPGEPVWLAAAARGEVVEAPGTDARAEIITFGEDLAPSLARVAPGDSIFLAGWPVAPEERADVQATRFDIYAPDAKIWRIEGDRRIEVPRSRLVFFQGEVPGDPETRVFISVDPETYSLSGFTFTPEGFQELHPLTKLQPEMVGTRKHVLGPPEAFRTDADEAASWSCEQLGSPLPLGEPARESSSRSFSAPAISTLHTATVAVDTDNEIMNNKFGGNTTTATNYLASLFAAMNVAYERDLLIRLLQGTTFLRPGSGDPYSSTGNGSQKLVEFTNFWSANNGGIVRALAAMVSGRGAAPNSASGSAWINTLCEETFGYSYSVASSNGTAPSALEIETIAHEIGHNFGSPHTHCYSPPVDTCFSGDVSPGFTCHNGATSCPAPTTIGGIPNVRGTIMSYCHPPFLAGCTSSLVFHPATVSMLQPLIQEEVNDCIIPGITPPTVSQVVPNNGTTAGGVWVAILGTGFQSGATVNFGGTIVASNFVSSTQLTVVTPAHATGTVSVTVTNPDTGSGSLANAYFYAPPPTASDFYTLSPCRVFDTRNANGPQGGPQLTAFGERSFPVAGQCGVPANALAVAGNLAVITPTGAGDLSVYPGNAFYLGTTVLSFPGGTNIASNLVMRLATNGTGTIKVRNGSSGTSHVIFDVVGYFIP